MHDSLEGSHCNAIEQAELTLLGTGTNLHDMPALLRIDSARTA